MSTHPYIPLYVDDYDSHTSHLSIEEDGAYCRLLRLAWRTPGCSLPNDTAWIARKIRLSAEDFERVAMPVLDEFFRLHRGRFVQRRLKAEYDDISRKKSARKQAGKKGGSAKARKSQENEASNASVLLADTRAFHTHTHTQNHKEGSEDKSSGGKPPPADLLSDPNWTAWQLAKDVLGRAMPEKQTGGAFGKLLSRHGLEARDLLPALAQAQISETRDPMAYLTRAAEGVAKRREPAKPKRVGFV